MYYIIPILNSIKFFLIPGYILTLFFMFPFNFHIYLLNLLEFLHILLAIPNSSSTTYNNSYWLFLQLFHEWVNMFYCIKLLFFELPCILQTRTAVHTLYIYIFIFYNNLK